MSAGYKQTRLLFEQPAKPTRSIPPRDTNVAPSDVPRLKGQNAAILERLLKGPATNAELASLSLKYTSRISDIRKAGYSVICERGEGGTTHYSLSLTSQVSSSTTAQANI